MRRQRIYTVFKTFRLRPDQEARYQRLLSTQPLPRSFTSMVIDALELLYAQRFPNAVEPQSDELEDQVSNVMDEFLADQDAEERAASAGKQFHPAPYQADLVEVRAKTPTAGAFRADPALSDEVRKHRLRAKRQRDRRKQQRQAAGANGAATAAKKAKRPARLPKKG